MDLEQGVPQLGWAEALARRFVLCAAQLLLADSNRVAPDVVDRALGYGGCGVGTTCNCGLGAVHDRRAAVRTRVGVRYRRAPNAEQAAECQCGGCDAHGKSAADIHPGLLGYRTAHRESPEERSSRDCRGSTDYMRSSSRRPTSEPGGRGPPKIVSGGSCNV